MRVEPHSMPRREGLPLLNFAMGCKYYASAKVLNKGRLPQNCIETKWVSAR